MKYPSSILRGYDRDTEKRIANALHMPLKKRKLKRKVVKQREDT